MSYFDHVQCHSCGARMNPEQLAPGRGEMPACPYCNATLNLADLFGVKDAFVGLHDDEGNDHSLDDLVGGTLYDGRYADGRAPEPQQPAYRSPSAPRSAGRPSGGSRTPSLRQLTGSAPAPSSSRPNALVRHGAADDEPAPSRPAGKPSALELLRQMKKK